MTAGPHPWLLPGELHDEPTGRRTARDWIVDVVAFGAAFGVGAFVAGLTWDQHGELGILADLLLGALSLALLWVRRRWPAAVAGVACACSAVSGIAAGPALVATFTAVIRCPWRKVLLVLSLWIGAAAVFPLLYPTEDSYALELLIAGLITAVVAGWGLFARARRQLVLSLRERARRAEAEQALRVEGARAAERRRIAREMHDVLAHRLSLLSLHAGALEYHAEAPPEEVERAAGVIRATAHQALDELREVIGVLREGDDPPPDEPPQPTLERLEELVVEWRAAGARVALRVDLAGAIPGDAAGRTAYRIVQEALTNARKHAPGAAVEVDVRGEPGRRLVVAIRNRAPVGVAAAPPPPGAGTGLVGLRERVALAGGTLEHGPDDRGDFVVRAELPWEP